MKRAILFLLFFLHTLKGICFDLDKSEIRPTFLTYEQVQKTYRTMRIIDKLFRKHKIEYFVKGGTLLGAIRHKGFIPWDKDVDVIVSLDEYNHILKLEEELNFYGLYLDTNHTTNKFNVRDLTDSSVCLDIFFYTIGRTLDWQKRIFLENKYLRIFSKDYFLLKEIYPLRRAQFGNFTINIPNNPYPYFERHFNKNWETIGKHKDSELFAIPHTYPVPDEDYLIEEDPP